MKLKYRGVQYEQQSPTLELREKKVIGKYRGQACYRATYELPGMLPSRPRLRYRGVAYGGFVNETPSAVPASNMPVVDPSFKIKIPQTPQSVHSSRQQQISELNKVHNAYLLKSLEQRLSSARGKGDALLIQMLENERNQLA